MDVVVDVAILSMALALGAGLAIGIRAISARVKRGRENGRGNRGK